VSIYFAQTEPEAVRHFSWNDENTAISRSMDGGSEKNPQQWDPDHGIANAAPQNAPHVRKHFHVAKLAFSSAIGLVWHHWRTSASRVFPMDTEKDVASRRARL